MKNFIFIFLLLINTYPAEAKNTPLTYNDFKPLPEINLFIGSEIKETYISLKEYLIDNCRFTTNKKDGTIGISFSENEIINYAKIYSSRFYCNINYEFLDIQNKYQKEEVKVSIDTCNGLVSYLNISPRLRPYTYDKNPKILNYWISFFKSFSSLQPRIQKTERSSILGGKEVFFDKEQYIWSDDKKIPERKIFIQIISTYETERKSKQIYGQSFNFSQLISSDLGSNTPMNKMMKCRSD